VRREPILTLWAVRRARGGRWDWARDLREQDGWEEHATFMDGLVEDGFVILGGPLDGDREVLLVVDAPSEEAIHRRLAQDNWTANGMLTTTRVERWTVLLDGRR
jgi:uncharacterized protein YciI